MKSKFIRRLLPSVTLWSSIQQGKVNLCKRRRNNSNGSWWRQGTIFATMFVFFCLFFFDYRQFGDLELISLMGDTIFSDGKSVDKIQLLLDRIRKVEWRQFPMGGWGGWKRQEYTNLLINIFFKRKHRDNVPGFQSNNPYTNWDVDEPSTADVAKCTYVDSTSLAWWDKTYVKIGKNWSSL